jgi:hypothetical protein
MASKSKRTPSRNARGGRGAPKRQSWTAFWFIAGIAAAIALAAGIFLIQQNRGVALSGVETFSVAQGHVTGPVVYPVVPPVGGEHDPAWQNCGIYDRPVRNENAVHALEHGAVWITYRPELPAEAVEQLRELVRGRRYALLSPYESLPSPIVASAWGVQMKADSATDPRLSLFLTRYMQGPQTPEPGAPCSNGVGTPVSR